jgi:hypothetical protein
VEWPGSPMSDRSGRSADAEHAGIAGWRVAKRPARDRRSGLEPAGVPPEEAAGGSVRDDQVGGPELSHCQEATDQGVDAAVRRVGDHAEGVPRPAERVEVELEHGDATWVDALTQCLGTAWVQLDGQDATAGSGQRDGQSTVAGTEVDHDVSGPDG